MTVRTKNPFIMRMWRAPVLLATLVALVTTLLPTPAPASHRPVIAVLDSGIAAGHPEFTSGQVVGWRDFIDGRPAPYDDLGHGTSVASLAAGRTLGTSPRSPLLIGKVLRGNDTTSWGIVANGIRWAVDSGADVINVSLWGGTPNPSSSVLLSLAVQHAIDHGVVVVWIAGNGYSSGGAAPNPTPATVLPGANSSQVIVVGSADADGKVSSFSQLDPEVLALGRPSRMACGGSWYCTGGWGTSYAAPRIAGYVARMLEAGAPADPDWIEWVLLHSADDRDEHHYLEEGYGLFDDAALERALRVVRGQAPMPAPDERDAFHLAVTGARTAQSAAVPTGALPPD